MFSRTKQMVAGGTTPPCHRRPTAAVLGLEWLADVQASVAVKQHESSMERLAPITLRLL